MALFVRFGLPLPIRGGGPRLSSADSADSVGSAANVNVNVNVNDGRQIQPLPSSRSNHSGSYQSALSVSPIGSVSPVFGLEPRRQINDQASGSLIKILCLEGSRLLKFLPQQEDPTLRCLSSGFGFRVSVSRFASLPEERQRQILQDMDSEATSDSTSDPGYVDDVAPGFEEFLDSTSSDDQFGRPDSRGGSSSHMPNSGGASPSNMPNSGGAIPSYMPISGGGGQRYSENEGAWISVDSSHNSSSAPSIRAVGRVKSDASGVEVLAQQKLG